MFHAPFSIRCRPFRRQTRERNDCPAHWWEFAATTLLEGAAVTRADALRALRPLLDASLQNALTMEANQALTGPIARGDAVAMRRHLGSMRNSPTPLVGLYRAFGEYLLHLAQRRGLPASEAAAVRSALSEEC